MFLGGITAIFFQMPLFPGFQSILYAHGLRTFSQKKCKLVFLCAQKPALQCREISLNAAFQYCCLKSASKSISACSACTVGECSFSPLCYQHMQLSHSQSQLSSNRICRSLINTRFLTSVSHPRSNNASGAIGTLHSQWFWHSIIIKCS